MVAYLNANPEHPMAPRAAEGATNNYLYYRSMTPRGLERLVQPSWPDVGGPSMAVLEDRYTCP